MKAMVSMRTAGLGMACSTAALLTTFDEAGAATYLFKNLHTIGEEHAYDNAKPTIADNGSVAFLDIKDYATDERIIVAPAFGDKVVLLDSGGPLNVVGPGISEFVQATKLVDAEHQPLADAVDRDAGAGGDVRPDVRLRPAADRGDAGGLVRRLAARHVYVRLRRPRAHRVDQSAVDLRQRHPGPRDARVHPEGRA